MRKQISILLALVLVLTSLIGSFSLAEGMSPGTYQGEEKGYGGQVVLDVTVDAEKITDIQVVKQEETPGIGGAALPLLIESVLQNQTITVDSVSGATVTSAAFKEALTAALKQAGADIEKMSQPVEKTAEKEETVLEADLVVVGGGAAGLCAALAAQQLGKKVILIEKTGVLGGASAMAGSGTIATGSDWQKEDGFEDSPEKLKEDLIANGHNHNHEATVDIFVNSVGKAFNWLVSPEGANVPYVRSGKPSRSYSGEGRGAGVITNLAKSFEAIGGVIMTNTKGAKLIVEDGVVKGVLAEGAQNNFTITAKAVVLATGGFGANDSMVPDEYKKFVYAGHAGATGDGIMMAEAVQADLINMQFVNTQPNSMILPSGLGQYTNPGVSGAYNSSGAFLVNQNGERFANEQGNAWDLMQEMKKNTAQYLVMDQTSFDGFNAGMLRSNIYKEEDIQTWLNNDGQGQPFMVKAETLDALGDKLGLAAGVLPKTTATFNEEAAKGEDSFGRKIAAPLSAEGPYYALELHIRYYATLGGLHIDENMAVLNKDLQPVPGLYAAGEVVGGLNGDVYMAATLFGWAVTSGYNAGVSAANSIGQ